jgi:nucleoside-diphosphate-sugar epimerase
MKMLLTGALGNIGWNLIPAIVERGYNLRCFDRETEATALLFNVEIYKGG